MVKMLRIVYLYIRYVFPVDNQIDIADSDVLRKCDRDLVVHVGGGGLPECALVGITVTAGV